MERLKTFNWILLALLGVAAGVAKMSQVPQEMAFFQGQMGFTTNVIVSFGFLQLVGGLMLVFPKTRLVGAILLGLTLFVSCVVLFMGGKTVLGVVSVVPVLMADVTAWLELKAYNAKK